MQDLLSWCWIIGITIYGFVVSTTLGIFLVKISRRFQMGRTKFIQIVIGLLAFTLGIVTSYPIVIYTVVLISGGGYGIFTFHLWLLITGILQIVVNFGFVSWSIYRGKVFSYNKTVILCMIGCAAVTFIFVLKETLLWKGIAE